MKKTFKNFTLLSLLAAIFICCAPEASAQSRAGQMLKLWLEAEVEDGADTTWKFYLYGSEMDGDGEMTCTYGSKKYEGNWEKNSENGKTVYILSFLSNETPTFNCKDGNAVPLTSSAIVMTGFLEGKFVIYTFGGQTIPFSQGYSYDGAARQVYPCELLD
ncbi:MAG: hypothetical protein J6C81_08835 [Muribaculaceae bacterium]|nr:hypothetical protein [Muribaculaceae bacterium]